MFKAGDTVRIIKKFDSSPILSWVDLMDKTVGCTGKVGVIYDGVVEVKIQELQPFANGWFYYPECLELVSSSSDEALFEIFKKFKEPAKEVIAEDSSLNPKAAHGSSSLPLHMFSPLAVAYGCVGKANGALKYGGANYLGTEVVATIYVDAIKRHLDKWLCGEEFDSADGVPHFGACLANLDILISAQTAGTLVDDRPLIKGYTEKCKELTAIYNSLQELHKDKQPKHYYLKDAK